MKKNFLFLILAVVMFLSAGCGKKQGPEDAVKKPKPVVSAVKAEKRDLIKTQIYPGSVEPVKVARMASPAEGPVEKCSIREGDIVKTGQVLLIVGRSQTAKSGLEAAREELKRQESEFNRIEQLVKSGSLPGEQMDSVRVDLKRAQAQVAALETSASDYEILAPWDGVVSKIWIADGNYVAPRVPLVELYDPFSLVVRITIPEQEFIGLKQGQPVQIELDAYPDRKFSGEITRIFPELDRTTRTMNVETVIREDVRLLSGMFARAGIPVKKTSDSIVIPERAIVVMPNGETTVFVLKEDKVQKRKVKILLEAGNDIAIESGIEAGEQVVVSGNESLKDGASVQVMGKNKNTNDSGGSFDEKNKSKKQNSDKASK